ncbi:hypothetical protein HYT45_01890 [Candidatus Uhrbacteria bacterium]|nr:hypothetical protein [Candidatus Uhrbacteria bacterium]
MNNQFVAQINNFFAGKRRRILVVFALLLALILLLPPALNIASAFKEERRVAAKIKNNPAWSELYSAAKEGDKLLKKDEDNLEMYLSAGFRWKSVADATTEAVFYRNALDVYDKAIKKFGDRNYLPFLNAANVLRYLKEFERADRYYLEAIKSNPGEAGIYIARAELMRYDLKKTPEEIRAFYQKGLAVLVGQEVLRLAADYVSYLVETEQFAEALQMYKKLALIMPGHEPYQAAIKELEEKLANQTASQLKE